MVMKLVNSMVIKMCKFNPKNNGRRIDPCVKQVIEFLNNSFANEGIDYRTVASCCGYGKYPKTIVVEVYHRKLGIHHFEEIFSGKLIPREKRFYVKDKQGYYYIPEVIKNGKN